MACGDCKKNQNTNIQTGNKSAAPQESIWVEIAYSTT